MTHEEAIDWIEERAALDEDTGCILWKLQVDKKGAPVCRAEGAQRNVRPWLFSKMVGPVPKGYRLVPACGVLRCIHPGCALPLSVREMFYRAQAEGRFNQALQSATARATGARLSPYSEEVVAKARRMRGEGARLQQISDELGPNMTTISLWVRGVCRVGTQAAGASVFTWRPAA
jgi:hypothetical protein